MRVLLVDDSPVIRGMLREMLEELGHQVSGEAHNASSALRLYQDERPEAVLLDISLPEVDGLAVLQDLRRIDPQAQVIVVTANHQRRLQEEVAALKAIAFLGKPFRIDELSAVLEKARPAPAAS